MAEEVEDTGKRKIDNGEAWERYVKRFRSNFEAAEQFIAANLSDVITRLWIKSDPIVEAFNMLSNARFVVRSTMSGLVHKSMQDQVASLWKNIYLPACLQMIRIRIRIRRQEHNLNFVCQHAAFIPCIC